MRDETEATGGTPAPAVGRAVLLLGIAAFATVATMRVADPLIPQVAAEFEVGAGDAAVISSAFTIAYAIGQFVYGPLGDRFGKLRLIAWMTVISGFTVAAAGLAGSLQSLGLLRLIGGATAAAIVPLGMAFIGDHVDYQHRQTMLARMMSGTIAGVILGQVFGGLIGEHFGWRAVFPMLGLVFLAIGALLFREHASKSLPPPKLSPAISISSLIQGYAGLLRLPWARVILVTVFIEGFLFYGAFTFIGADLHQRFALDYGTVGLFLCFMGLGGLAYILSVRRLVKRLGERGLAAIGGLLVAIGLGSLPIAPLVLVPIGQFLLGLGLYMLHNTLQTNATQMAPDARGLAVSTFANALFLGQAAGIAASGILVDRYGFAPSYLIAAVGLFLLGLTFSRLLDRRP
ncbi:MAG: MFS transporter [Alphaproteobacteria bacterium]|nr:MFS transporter [Alphaproteobacteria bacterium]